MQKDWRNFLAVSKFNKSFSRTIDRMKFERAVSAGNNSSASAVDTMSFWEYDRLY
jgi:hypothetical protein